MTGADQNSISIRCPTAAAAGWDDGVPVDENAFIPVGDGDYEVARVLTPDGVHTVDGLGDPCSVIVVGFDSYDSYAYLGGVGTSVINPDPQD